MSNYSFKDPDLPDGSVIDAGNFTQLRPKTEIMVGKALTINGGNFTNVKQQPEWIINGGLWISKSFCTNVRHNLIDKGLTVCGTECAHMVEKSETIIDGVVVDILYDYEETVT